MATGSARPKSPKSMRAIANPATKPSHTALSDTRTADSPSASASLECM